MPSNDNISLVCFGAASRWIATAAWFNHTESLDGKSARGFTSNFRNSLNAYSSDGELKWIVMLNLTRKSVTTRLEWEDLAALDPLWAILSDGQKQFGKWDIEQFFASGQREIDQLMQECGVRQRCAGRVLDFGCGVGRLSRALRSYFEEVYGVDISGQMIELARTYSPSCNFVVNQTDDLNLFEDEFFDFVYSNIVLQHQRNKDVVKAYIHEFIRVIKPNGTVVFQIPHRLSFRQAVQPKRRAYSLLKKCGVSATYLYNRLHLNPMRTISVPCCEVEQAVSSAGGTLLRSIPDSFNTYSRRYFVTKH